MRSAVWMAEQTQHAVGIHMASPSKKSLEQANQPPDTEDIDISGWTAPPHMMAEWAKAV